MNPNDSKKGMAKRSSDKEKIINGLYVITHVDTIKLQFDHDTHSFNFFRTFEEESKEEEELIIDSSLKNRFKNASPIISFNSLTVIF